MLLSAKQLTYHDKDDFLSEFTIVFKRVKILYPRLFENTFTGIDKKVLPTSNFYYSFVRRKFSYIPLDCGLLYRISNSQNLLDYIQYLSYFYTLIFGIVRQKTNEPIDMRS